MIARFDHAVIAVRDLEASIGLYGTHLGLHAAFGGRHTGRGTHNALVRFGLDYLELLAIYDRAEALAAGYRRASLVAYLDRFAGGMVGYCLACDDLDALAARFAATGLEVTGPFDMERMRPDGTLLRWRLLVPGTTSWRRPWPFFIHWEMPDAARLQAEGPGAHPLGVMGVAGVSVIVRAQEDAVRLYGEQMGLPLVGEETLPAANARRLRFSVPGIALDLLVPLGAGMVADALAEQGEGLWSVTLAVADPAAAAAYAATAGTHMLPAPERPDGQLLVSPALAGARFVLVSETESTRAGTPPDVDP